MSLRAVNVNLLPVLHALLSEQSVSRAALVLGLSQPATSNALGRLRAVFGDPLLVQVGRQMRMTPRAKQILPPLRLLCADIEALLKIPEFDPLHAARSFVVATLDYVAFLLGGELQEMLTVLAPKVTVHFIDVRADFNARLIADECDMAIVAWDEAYTKGLSHLRGYFDRMVGVVARAHPLAGTAPRLKDLSNYSGLIMNPGRELPVASGPGRINFGGHTRFITEQFTVLPMLAARSDAVAFVPHTLARYFQKILPISILQIPAEDWNFEVCALWNPARDADQGHRWFCDVVGQALKRRLGKRPPKTRGS